MLQKLETLRDVFEVRRENPLAGSASESESTSDNIRAVGGD
jgi:hypothetical protein